MTDEEFEIDIYGDASNEQSQAKGDDGGAQAYEADDSHHDNNDDYEGYDAGQEGGSNDHNSAAQSATITPQQAPQQGVKRKEGSDDRPVDPSATSALMISELNWWHTDDEIRGWVNQANCEDELKDITFSEHKVNGKSKGQAYVEFTSQQAATATKHKIDELAASSGHPGQKKQTVIYSGPANNPFRTLPKDAPARGGKDMQSRTPSAPYVSDRPNNNVGSSGNFSGPGYRGGRGGYNNGPRGGGMNPGGYNRNFSNNNMGYNNNNMGFNPMGGNYGGGHTGFNRGGGMMGGGMRGGPGGMRGGRGGGMNGMNMMGGMPMGGMPMGGMPGGMGGMGMMGGAMPGFGGMPPFNPAFFGGAGAQSGGGNDWQNPHGAKRARGE